MMSRLFDRQRNSAHLMEKFRGKYISWLSQSAQLAVEGRLIYHKCLVGSLYRREACFDGRVGNATRLLDWPNQDDAMPLLNKDVRRKVPVMCNDPVKYVDCCILATIVIGKAAIVFQERLKLEKTVTELIACGKAKMRKEAASQEIGQLTFSNEEPRPKKKKSKKGKDKEATYKPKSRRQDPQLPKAPLKAVHVKVAGSTQVLTLLLEEALNQGIKGNRPLHTSN
jgi:hypothetical protein